MGELSELEHVRRQLDAARKSAAEWESRFMKIWTANHDGFYYAEAGGTNLGNGYPGNPRGSIPVDEVPPGSLVIVK